MSSIFWADCPQSAGPRLGIQVHSVPPGGHSFVRFLDQPVGVWLHWLDTLSRPCLGHECPHCARGLAQRWKGYAAALLWARDSGTGKGVWRSVVCEITEAANAFLAARDLRGLIVEFRRPGRRRNGLLEVTVLEKPCTDPLPEAFDVRPILERLWDMRQRHLPVADPSCDILPFAGGSPAVEGKEAQS